jgi:hypothetical protein
MLHNAFGVKTKAASGVNTKPFGVKTKTAPSKDGTVTDGCFSLRRY